MKQPPVRMVKMGKGWQNCHRCKRFFHDETVQKDKEWFTQFKERNMYHADCVYVVGKQWLCPGCARKKGYIW